MHLYNFGTPLSIVTASGIGKSKVFRPVGVCKNRIPNPKTEPKTPKAPELGRKQAIYIGLYQSDNERLRVVNIPSMGGNSTLI